jgi:hypothetical protein
MQKQVFAGPALVEKVEVVVVFLNNVTLLVYHLFQTLHYLFFFVLLLDRDILIILITGLVQVQFAEVVHGNRNGLLDEW